MGIMVYASLWVMQDLSHHQKPILASGCCWRCSPDPRSAEPETINPQPGQGHFTLKSNSTGTLQLRFRV